jgi:hypothetical protein
MTSSFKHRFKAEAWWQNSLNNSIWVKVFQMSESRKFLDKGFDS